MQVKYKPKYKKQGRFFTAAVVAAIGLGISAVSGFFQLEAQADATKSSKKNEELRKRQARLDAERRKRREIRNMQIQRANIVNAAANQGAIGSSAQVGGAGSVTSTAGQNVTAINESQEIGGQIFDNNAQIADARSRANTAGAFGGFGSQVTSNASSISRASNQLFGVG